jgi:hypothetical protein
MHPPADPAFPLPLACATHSPLALHTFGARQSLTVLHCTRHAPVPWSQMYGVQSVTPASPEADEFCDIESPTQRAPPFGVHLPPVQTKPCTQSVSPEQLALHDVSSAQRRLFGHEAAPPLLHAPPPHVAVVSALPVHADRHDFPVGKVQALVFPPLHSPAQRPASPISHAVRDPRGAPFTGTHCPGLPGSSHASHCPSHAVAQQTPSTQLPVMHSSAVVHLLPFASPPMHTPTEHSALTHWSSSVHVAPFASLAMHCPPSQ